MKLKAMMVVSLLVLMSFSVIISDEETDGAVNTRFYVGQKMDGQTNGSLVLNVAQGSSARGNIPGISVYKDLVAIGNMACIRLEGTFTTPGDYVLEVLDSKNKVIGKETITVYVRSESIDLSSPNEAYSGIEFTVSAIVKPDNTTDKTVQWTVDGATMISSRVENGICYAVFKAASTGTCTITATPNDGHKAIAKSVTVTIKDPTHTEKISFDANGGTGAPSAITKTAADVSKNTVISIPKTMPTRTHYTFLGWSTDKNSDMPQYPAGGNITISRSSNLTLYAVWEKNILTIESCDIPSATIAGEEISFDVKSSAPGSSVRITGADWLVVDGMNVHGKTTSTGTYNITVTVFKDNYPSATVTKTVKVISGLIFVTTPSGGTSVWR